MESGHWRAYATYMTERTFLGLNDFTRACELAAENGFDVREAKYDGINFGYWSVEVSRKRMRPRLVLWEARDYWVSVMAKDAAGEWQGEWHIKEVTGDTPREVLARLLLVAE